MIIITVVDVLFKVVYQFGICRFSLCGRREAGACTCINTFFFLLSFIYCYFYYSLLSTSFGVSAIGIHECDEYNFCVVNKPAARFH